MFISGRNPGGEFWRGLSVIGGKETFVSDSVYNTPGSLHSVPSSLSVTSHVVGDWTRWEDLERPRKLLGYFPSTLTTDSFFPPSWMRERGREVTNFCRGVSIWGTRRSNVHTHYSVKRVGVVVGPGTSESVPWQGNNTGSDRFRRDLDRTTMFSTRLF